MEPRPHSRSATVLDEAGGAERKRMATALNERERGSLTHPDVESFDQVNRDILKILSRPGKGWWALFLLSVAGVGLFFTSWIYQIVTGIGVSGLMSPVGWGVYITTFVFWVGIAHSGTLISAILFLSELSFLR